LTDVPATRDSPGQVTTPEESVRESRRQLLWVFLATLVVVAYMLVWTAGTQPIMGDEARHFRRAVNYFEAPLPQFRVTHDPAYPSGEPGTVQYWDAALWHLILALVWKAIGSASMAVAQVYHSLYLIVLVVVTYLAARRLYGHRGGLWAWALLLTMPMNLLFGMIFYMEISVMAFTALAVYLLVCRRPVLLGMALAGMFLTKSTSSMVLIPPMLGVALLVMGQTWRQRILRTAVAGAVAFVLVLPDMIWHKHHFGLWVMFRYSPPVAPLPVDLTTMPKVERTSVLSIFEPLILLKMFGATGLVTVLMAVLMAVDGLLRALWRNVRNLHSGGIAAALIRVPETYPTHALIFGVPLLVYLLGYAVLMKGAYDVRYLHPIALFTCLMAAGWLVREPLAAVYRLHKVLGRLIVAGLVVAMAGQLATVPPYLGTQLRRLHPEVLKGFQWIRENTDPGDRFFYIEENLTTMTGRPIYWAAAIPRYVFYAQESEQMAVLTFLKIRYIAIHPERQGPGAGNLIEPVAYPEAWVEDLQRRDYLTRVYPETYTTLRSACSAVVPTATKAGSTSLRSTSDGKSHGRFLIYRLEYDKIPEAWKKAEPPTGAGRPD